jgi:hypothetical protein
MSYYMNNTRNFIAGLRTRLNVFCMARPGVPERRLVVPSAAVAEAPAADNGAFGVFTLNYNTSNVRRRPLCPPDLSRRHVIQRRQP